MDAIGDVKTIIQFIVLPLITVLITYIAFTLRFALRELQQWRREVSEAIALLTKTLLELSREFYLMKGKIDKKN